MVMRELKKAVLNRTPQKLDVYNYEGEVTSIPPIEQQPSQRHFLDYPEFVAIIISDDEFALLQGKERTERLYVRAVRDGIGHDDRTIYHLEPFIDDAATMVRVIPINGAGTHGQAMPRYAVY